MFCTVQNVLLMCAKAKLRNFDVLKRIIGMILENNFQELQNRIFGKILSIIASSLLA